MKCPICKHGATRPGFASVTLERGDSTLVFKQVPAEVCENCGEEFIDEAVSRKLFAAAQEAANKGVEVDVRRYAAA